MKKVLALVLVIVLALGGIGFAHAAVTDAQDALLIYPSLEIGDPSVLAGRTASMTFTCGNHLRWYTDHTFGGDTVTEFDYDVKDFQPPAANLRSTMDLWFTGGTSSSVSGGEFYPNSTDYGALLKAVAAATPDGGSKTMNLRMKDYVDYYLPDYELSYRGDGIRCSESVSLHGLMTGERWYEEEGCYRELMEAFRFPVQDGHIMSVSIDKDDAGRIVGLGLAPENGPELYFISDVNDNGVWFIPVFRDEHGAPLPYESPAGHGIYFIPWKNAGAVYISDGKECQQVTLDVEKAELCYPLEATLNIRHMVIDAEAGTATMLTVEENQYQLTVCDLENGTVRSRLTLCPYDSDLAELGDDTAFFNRVNEYLLIVTQDTLSLSDAAGEKLLLSAPDTTDLPFGAQTFDPDTGSLYFDGENLILTDNTYYRDGTFWTAAWRQNELTYYGEYDCSLMRGNENWYYRSVSAEEYPMELK